MKLKEAGYVLSIDQASNLAGVSLWRDGELRATTVLKSQRSTDVFSRRIQFQLDQLTPFLCANTPPDLLLTKVVFEGVRSRLVLVTVGAFLACPKIAMKLHQKHSFVESTQWKKWAKDRGAQGLLKDIKGVTALRESTGDAYPEVQSDDVADSILIYLTWRDRP